MTISQTKKKILEAGRKHGTGITITEANKMINDANEEAFEKMDYFEQLEVVKVSDHLKKQIKGLGDQGAFELLATLSEFLGGSE